MNGRHLVEVLIHGAHQNLAPETVDRVGRLALLQEPIEHTDAVEIFTAGALAAQRQKRARNRDFVGAAQAMQAKKRLREVERLAGRRPRRRVERRPPGSRK